MRRSVKLLLVAIALTCFSIERTSVVRSALYDGRKLKYASDEDGEELIDGSYTVVMLDDSSVDNFAFDLMMRSSSARLEATFQHVFTGFVADGVDENLLSSLEKSPLVKYIEQNKRITLDTVQSPVASWGLDRLDEIDNRYEYFYTGAGVEAYFIDSGIRSSHEDFGGRANCAASFVPGELDCEDFAGHGTSVAAIVGGETFGVAKDVELYALKAFDANQFAQTQWILLAMEWMIGKKRMNPSVPMVCNLSFTIRGEYFHEAVRRMVRAGIVVTAAAGNMNDNACRYSPAGVESVITVASTTIDDHKSDFSNYGACVDVFAPGSDITSADATNDTASNVNSGTSLSAPHVAGLASLFLERDPTFTPLDVKRFILGNAVQGVLSDTVGSPNLLASTKSFTEQCQGILRKCFTNEDCCRNYCLTRLGLCFIRLRN